MKPRFLAWRQTVRKHPVRSFIALVFVLLVAFALFVYLFGWDWTGFNGGFSQVTSTSTSHGITTTNVQPPGKTLWDLLQLLSIPIMLVVGGFWLNNLQKSRDEKTTEQRAEGEKKDRKKSVLQFLISNGVQWAQNHSWCVSLLTTKNATGGISRFLQK